MELANLKVAIIHYWFISWRGGEKVVRSLLDLFPNADIYTLFYDEKQCGKYLMGHRVTSSVLDTPILRERYQKIFPLFPTGVKSLKLDQKYDLILSCESGPAKGISRGKLNKDTPHLCYVHTPMRYCYGYTEEYLAVLPSWLKPMAKMEFMRLRRWDLKTVNNVDLYVANSKNVQDRIQTCWGKGSKVIHPCIESRLFKKELPQEKKEHYLSFGAITPYKRIDLLVEAFNQNGKPLVIIGNGSEKEKLQAKAKPNIRFMGFLENPEIDDLVARSRALLFPGEEDFGMIPLEVMAKGIPVIAYGKGGALETVVENEEAVDKSTGLFFKEQTAEAINQALERFEAVEDLFEPAWIRSHAEQFEDGHFKIQIRDLIRDFLKTPMERK